MHIATLHAAGAGAKLSYTDATSWVNPGLGYRYAARTLGADGALSETVETIVQTPAEYPDLVIGDFGIDGAEDARGVKPGGQVRFGAVLKNQGAGPTPSPAPASAGMYNSSLSVTFRVDGKVASWGGDGGQSPMEPGETRAVKGTGGPSPSRAWTAETGTHILRAEADDIGRIASERRRNNNLATKTITVGDYAGLLHMESRPAPGSFDLESGAPRDWVHFRRWNGNGENLRKPGADIIGGVRQAGSGHIAVNPGCAVHIMPSQNRAGLWGNGKGNGYEFKVPADKEERVLKVFVSATNGGKGEFHAELPDGSAPAFTDAEWNGDANSAWAPVPGEFSAVYTLRFRAASDGQALKARWRLANEPNRFRAQIRLQAAVLY